MNQKLFYYDLSTGQNPRFNKTSVLGAVSVLGAIYCTIRSFFGEKQTENYDQVTHLFLKMEGMKNFYCSFFCF